MKKLARVNEYPRLPAPFTFNKDQYWLTLLLIKVYKKEPHFGKIFEFRVEFCENSESNKYYKNHISS